MVEIANTIVLPKSAAEVFDFVTTAGKWKLWHPKTVDAAGAGDHPAKTGEKIFEKIRLGFLRGKIDWTVRECRAPELWVIDGVISAPLAEQTNVTITYALSPRGSETLFHRTMVYAPPNALARWLNGLFIKAHNERESVRALENLKKVLSADGRGE